MIMNEKCTGDDRAQLSVNATVLFPHHIPASLFPGVKRGRPTLGDQVDRWPGLGRHGKAEKFNRPSHRQRLSHFSERTHARTLQPAAARCARYALPRKDAVSSAHRTRRTRENRRAFQHVSGRFAGVGTLPTRRPKTILWCGA